MIIATNRPDLPTPKENFPGYGSHFPLDIGWNPWIRFYGDGYIAMLYKLAIIDD